MVVVCSYCLIVGSWSHLVKRKKTINQPLWAPTIYVHGHKYRISAGCALSCGGGGTFSNPMAPLAVKLRPLASLGILFQYRILLSDFVPLPPLEHERTAAICQSSRPPTFVIVTYKCPPTPFSQKHACTIYPPLAALSVSIRRMP